MTARQAIVFCLVNSIATLFGCDIAPDSTPDRAPDEGSITIENAWLRPPLIAERPGAGYFDLVNHSGLKEVIVDASVTTPADAVVEIHETISRDGRMAMRRIESLDLEPNEQISLEPGGKHLMVFGIAPETTYIELELILASGATVRVTLSAEPRRAD